MNWRIISYIYIYIYITCTVAPSLWNWCPKGLFLSPSLSQGKKIACENLLFLFFYFLFLFGFHTRRKKSLLGLLHIMIHLILLYGVPFFFSAKRCVILYEKPNQLVIGYWVHNTPPPTPPPPKNTINPRLLGKFNVVMAYQEHHKVLVDGKREFDLETEGWKMIEVYVSK